jgi:hypothetical protein
MTSWRPLAAGTFALFLIVLAFLAGQMRAGADPALRRAAAAQTPAPPAQTQPATPPAQPDYGAGPDGLGSGDGTVPYVAPDGSSSGGTVPRAPAPDPAPPTTHQS